MSLRISELDFHQIKENLKDYLRGQSQFSDFDFEGSALSVLIDVLAYNTFYQSYYANMLLSESFLDSAIKESSVVSLAKHLGYTPRSKRGSTASVTVTVINPTGLPAKLTIDKYTPFSTQINGTNYTFLTTDSHTASRTGNAYTFSNITLKEGTFQQFAHVVADISTSARYEIPSSDVDTSTLTVSVQKSAIDTTSNTFTLVSDTSGLTGASEVFFLEKNPMGKFQIYFGDGILGKSLEYGNIVILKFLDVVGEETNISSLNSQSFTAPTIGGSSDVSVTTITNSTGGADTESISSIKFNAPKFNAARNRAVTTEDFESLITSSYADAESISIWGGEENVPPIYGKVLVSLKPFSGFIISNTTKESIKNDILRNKKLPTIQVQFVDPIYLHVGLNVVVEYDSSLTSKSRGNIEVDVTNAINSYFSSNLQKFNADYKHSGLTSTILATNTAIKSCIATVKLQYRVIPILNSTNIYIADSSIKLRNSLKPGDVNSSYFYIRLNQSSTLVKITDIPNETPPNYQGKGTLRLINVNNGEVVNSNIGEVNYFTGEMTIIGITPIGLPQGAVDIRFTCGVQESNYNLSAINNEIFLLDNSTENKISGVEAGLSVELREI